MLADYNDNDCAAVLRDLKSLAINLTYPFQKKKQQSTAHRIHVWSIYLH